MLTNVTLPRNLLEQIRQLLFDLEHALSTQEYWRERTLDLRLRVDREIEMLRGER